MCTCVLGAENLNMKSIGWCLCAQAYFLLFQISTRTRLLFAALPDGTTIQHTTYSPIRKTQTTERNERRTNPVRKKCDREKKKKERRRMKKKTMNHL